MDTIADWLLALFLILIPFIAGHGIAKDRMKDQAIEHGCAFYDPVTSDFTWKDVK